MPQQQPEAIQAASPPPSDTAVPKRRLSTLDWIAVVLLALGGVFVATGLLPVGEADATVHRILPLLLFLVTVPVLAELTAQAGLFDVIAVRVAMLAGGRYVALFALCVVFGSVTTIALNLDTTAVLLTPVMLALASSLGIPPLPLAMTTVWLANTASLLLPVSNLTNLLAQNRIGLSPLGFAGQMGGAQAAAIAVTMVLLWVFYWRGRSRYDLPQRYVPADRALLGVSAAACLLFVGAILGGVQVGVASAIAAGVLVVAFGRRRRQALSAALIPWRLPFFVTGLFLVVQTLSLHVLGGVISDMISSSGGAAGAFRAAATGAGMSNILNNLPAYVAGEAAVPQGHHVQLLGLLIGTNVGPVVTPWASMATLLWYERCRTNRVRIPMARFVLTGLTLAAAGIAASVGVLLLT